MIAANNGAGKRQGGIGDGGKWRKGGSKLPAAFLPSSLIGGADAEDERHPRGGLLGDLGQRVLVELERLLQPLLELLDFDTLALVRTVLIALNLVSEALEFSFHLPLLLLHIGKNKWNISLAALDIHEHLYVLGVRNKNTFVNSMKDKISLIYTIQRFHCLELFLSLLNRCRQTFLLFSRLDKI